MSKLKFGRCLLPDILRKKDISMTRLAEDTGYDLANISAYCNNRRYMSYITAVNIARYLGCTSDDLYDWEQDKEQ